MSVINSLFSDEIHDFKIADAAAPCIAAAHTEIIGVLSMRQHRRGHATINECRHVYRPSISSLDDILLRAKALFIYCKELCYGMRHVFPRNELPHTIRRNLSFVMVPSLQWCRIHANAD